MLEEDKEGVLCLFCKNAEQAHKSVFQVPKWGPSDTAIIQEQGTKAYK